MRILCNVLRSGKIKGHQSTVEFQFQKVEKQKGNGENKRTHRQSPWVEHLASLRFANPDASQNRRNFSSIYSNARKNCGRASTRRNRCHWIYCYAKRAIVFLRRFRNEQNRRSAREKKTKQKTKSKKLHLRAKSRRKAEHIHFQSAAVLR